MLILIINENNKDLNFSNLFLNQDTNNYHWEWTNISRKYRINFNQMLAIVKKYQINIRIISLF